MLLRQFTGRCIQRVVYVCLFFVTICTMSFVRLTDTFLNFQFFSPTTTIEEEIKSRSLQMLKACQRNNLTGPDSWVPLTSWEYLINQERQLVWCNIFKHGSTSWLNIFNELRNLRGTKLPPVEIARRSYRRPSIPDLLSAMNVSISFIVGRNPFERLVSGFVDKILHAKPNTVFDFLCRQIVNKHRVLNLQSQLELLHMPHNLRRGAPKPTFTEFIKHLIDENKTKKEMNMHWEPAYKFCSPCQVNFTYILKMDTMERDQSFLLDVTKLSKFVKPHKDNASKGKISTKELTFHLINQLPEDLFNKLLEIYRIDFEIFGYDVPKFDPLQHEIEMANLGAQTPNTSFFLL